MSSNFEFIAPDTSSRHQGECEDLPTCFDYVRPSTRKMSQPWAFSDGYKEDAFIYVSVVSS